MLTHERLLEVIHYDPETGIMRWRKTLSNRAQAGQAIKGLSPEGYLRVRIDRKLYQAHRVAYFYMTHEWPEQVDHVNNIPSDMRFINLRAATHAANLKNMKRCKRNTSGIKGVSWDASRNKWKASLMSDRVTVLNKRFDTREEAEQAVVIMRKKYHQEFANNG